MPYVLGAVLFAGLAIGFGLRFALDRAELAAYRRIARGTEYDAARHTDYHSGV